MISQYEGLINLKGLYNLISALFDPRGRGEVVKELELDVLAETLSYITDGLATLLPYSAKQNIRSSQCSVAIVKSLPRAKLPTLPELVQVSAV